MSNKKNYTYIFVCVFITIILLAFASCGDATDFPTETAAPKPTAAVTATADMTATESVTPTSAEVPTVVRNANYRKKKRKSLLLLSVTARERSAVWY